MTTYTFYPKEFKAAVSPEGDFNILESHTGKQVTQFSKDSLPTDITTTTLVDLFQYVVHTVHGSNPTKSPEFYRDKTINALQSSASLEQKLRLIAVA